MLSELIFYIKKISSTGLLTVRRKSVACCSKFICLLFVWPGIIFCQNVDSESAKWTVDVEAGISKQLLTDKTFSSVTSSGWAFSGGGLVMYTTPKWQHSSSFYYQQATLANRYNEWGAVQVKQLNADYFLLFKFRSKLNSLAGYKAGAGIDILNSSREYLYFINNNHSNDFAASLKAIVEFSLHPDHYLKGFSIANKTHFNLVSAVAQPVYGADAIVVPAEENSKKITEFIENLHILTIGSFLRIKNQFLISKEISVNQGLSLSYTIDYYNIDHFRTVEQLNHRFGLIYYFSF